MGGIDPRGGWLVESSSFSDEDFTDCRYKILDHFYFAYCMVGVLVCGDVA